MDSLIVGFGNAGRLLHLPCLRKARDRCVQEGIFGGAVGVVDPAIARDPGGSAAGMHCFSSMDEVTGFHPQTTVVHVCTPPGLHLATLRQVAALGFNRILAEKPLATTEAELAAIRRLCAERGLDLVVVANWIASVLTRRLRRWIDSGRFGPLLRVELQQHKPRFSRSLANPGHGSAFDVETPHQVALALYLAGADVRVAEGKVTDMSVGEAVVPHLGSAHMLLEHSNGVCSLLSSDLTAPLRKRSVELFFPDHRVLGYYPCDGTDQFMQWAVYDRDGSVVEEGIEEDDPLTNCFVEAYRYYSGKAPKPVSDLEFNASVVTALCQAKALAGMEAALSVSDV